MKCFSKPCSEIYAECGTPKVRRGAAVTTVAELDSVFATAWTPEAVTRRSAFGTIFTRPITPLLGHWPIRLHRLPVAGALEAGGSPVDRRPVPALAHQHHAHRQAVAHAPRDGHGRV